MISRTEKIAGEIKSILLSELSDLSEETAIAYSGGLDSTILMAAAGMKLSAYTIGINGSRDLANSRDASETLGFDVNFITVEKEDVARHEKILSDIDPEITRVEIGYEIVLSLVLENVSQEAVVTGQGADELFYGYRRFMDIPSLDNSQHLEKLFRRTLLREKKLADHYGKRLITPYLNEEIVSIAQSAGKDTHIVGDENKVVLRRVAVMLGLPESIAQRPKKAAQYGSGVSRVLRTQ